MTVWVCASATYEASVRDRTSRTATPAANDRTRSTGSAAAGGALADAAGDAPNEAANASTSSFIR